MIRSSWRVAVGVASAALLAGGALRTLLATPPGGAGLWIRTNHANREVTLLEGPAFVLGAAAGASLAGSPAGAAAAAAAGVLGGIDDLARDAARKGLRGHLAALAGGEVTTGAVKIVGLVVTGVAAAAITDLEPRRRDQRDVSRHARWASLLVGGAVVAGSANLVNLLDLRPGRALKATVLIGAPLALVGSPAAAAAVGAAGSSLPGDLAGRTMLGDTGANAAGALLGVALIERLGRGGRWGTLAVITALTLASEKVSFTRVIESTPGLRELDAWGRPAGPVSGSVPE